MSRGVVIYGVNNEKVDYVQLAVMCASFIRKNMPETDIHLITDAGSKAWQDKKGCWEIENVFTSFSLIETDKQLFKNRRTYKDTRYYHFEDTFKNESRSLIYDLSPYDETLLIDCDYLIANPILNCCWGSDQEIMINSAATNLFHEPFTGPEFRLNPFGIKMYWATVVYFKKGKKAALLFKLIEHIKENWDFYRLTYDVPGHLYRNDYAFSIAIHILNAFIEGDFVAPLPDPVLLTALDTDQFFSIKSPTDMYFFANDQKDNWKFFVSRTRDLNVHCMNKVSLLNNMTDIMETLK